jgi:phage shock protein A
MGIFSRFKKGVKSKANSAIDKMTSPEKELDMAIMELEEQRKMALKELLSYKATAKQMEQDMKSYEDKAELWEKKAMAAVRAGNDELAKKALRESKRCKEEVVKIRRDRDEAAGYAIELNRSRKKAETKLKMLKLRKGTMATQIAAARGGGDNPFSTDNELWDKLQRAEDAINAEEIEAEVDAAMKGEEITGSEAQLTEAQLEARLLAAAGEAASGTSGGNPDAALAQLKAKMAAKSTKQLPGKSEGSDD